MATLDPDFLGREADLAAVEATLESGARWVSIVGPPGVGKTTLMRRLGLGQASRWCDLTSAVAEDMIPHLSDGLGFEASETLPQALDPSTLILIDNAEQVATCLRPHVERWLREHPSVRVVLTSRVRLGSGAEHVHELGPLTDTASLLFRDRAARVGAVLEGPDADADIEAIVELLEGMPLSLELAASRLSVLSLGQLRRRLDTDLMSLRGAPGMFAERHRKLAATLQMTWSMLDEDSRAAVQALAHLPDGFGLETAAALLDLDQDDVEDLVYVLRGHSLLRGSDDACARRFRFFVAVQQFAIEQGDPARGRAAVLAWAIRHGKAWWAAELDAAQRAENVAERYNLLHAAAELLRQERVDDACVILVSIATSMGQFVNHEFSRLLEVVQRDAPGRDPSLHAMVVGHQATQLRISGDVPSAVQAAQRALRLARIDNRPAVVATVRHKLAVGLWRLGEIGRAKELFVQAADARRAMGADAAEASSRGGVAIMEHIAGNMVEAEAAFTRVVEIGLGCPQAVSAAVVARGNRSQLYWDTGRYELAESELRETIRLCYANEMSRYAAIQSSELARMLVSRGELDAAEAELDAAGVAVEEKAGIGDVGVCHIIRGQLRLRQGREADAQGCFEAGVEKLRTSGDIAPLVSGLLWMGAGLALAGRTEDAMARFDEADALLAPTPWQSLKVAARLHRLFPSVVSGAYESVRQQVATIREEGAPFSNNADAKEVVNALEDAVRARIALAASSGEALVLPPDATWFRLGEGETVVLKRRRAPRFLLARLAQHRVLSPGEPLSLWELIEAGWPGEDLHPDVGTNRLYVALATLRKLGLDEVIVTRSGGYAIADDVNVVLVSDGAQESASGR